jgi:integrase
LGLGINAWITSAGIEDGRLLRSVSKSGKINGDSLNDWVVWSVVEQSSKQIGIEHFAAHDLRRTCAKLCRKNGGDLEQIKFLLGPLLNSDHRALSGSERELR